MRRFFIAFGLVALLLGGTAQAQTGGNGTPAFVSLWQRIQFLLKLVAEFQRQFTKTKPQQANVGSAIGGFISKPTTLPPPVEADSKSTSTFAIIAVTPFVVPVSYNGTFSVNGTGFKDGAFVELGEGRLSTVGKVTPTLITAQYPHGWNPGIYGVSVVNPGGKRVTLAHAFAIQVNSKPQAQTTQPTTQIGTQSSAPSPATSAPATPDVYTTLNPWWWNGDVVVYTGAFQPKKITYSVKRAPNGIDYLYAEHTFWVPVSKLTSLLRECRDKNLHRSIDLGDPLRFLLPNYEFIALLNALRHDKIGDMKVTIALNTQYNYIEFTQAPSIREGILKLEEDHSLDFGYETNMRDHYAQINSSIHYPVPCNAVPGRSMTPTLWQ